MRPGIMLVVGLMLMAAGFATRFSCRQRPLPRRKAGESEAEAHIILLGTFRVYSWLIWINVLAVPLYFLPLGWFGPVYQAILILAFIATILITRALYWRLGYDSRRVFLVLGHLSGIFILSEYFFAVQGDVHAHLAGYARVPPPKA